MPAAKPIIAIFVAVALVVEVALFVGLGFGLGALSTTANPATSCISANEYCWSSTPFWASGTNSGQEVYVVSSVQQAADPVTSMLSGGLSTSITIGMQAADPPGGGGCPRTGAWQGGYEAWWTITWPQSVTGQIDGNQFTGSTWMGGVLAQNASIPANQGDLVGCANPTEHSGGCLIGSGDSCYLAGPTGILYQHTIKLVGTYPVMQMTATFHTQGQWCDKSDTGLTGACDALRNANVLSDSIGNNGGWEGSTSASFTWQTAAASFQFIDSQNNYNGGTLTAVFYTAYDGPTGYNFSINVPTERPNGGQVDTNFLNNPAVIPNFCFTGCEYKWAIPKNLNTNLSGENAQWDLWEGVLLATTVVEDQHQFTVINPLYAPTTPVIKYTTNGAGIYPAVGDQVTLTVYSNASQDSGMVQSIGVEVVYQSPGQGQQSQPSCGQAWVTPCPNGQILVLIHSGDNAVGTYTFTVNPPIGDTVIGVSAYSSSNYSLSLFGYLQINIKAADCAPGQTCDPLQSTQTDWGIIGPILLAAILLTLSVLVVLWVPMGMWYIRFGVPIAVGLVIIVLWALGPWTAMFAAGGLFNPNGGPS
jgi:hypothetical protein